MTDRTINLDLVIKSKNDQSLSNLQQKLKSLENDAKAAKSDLARVFLAEGDSAAYHTARKRVDEINTALTTTKSKIVSATNAQKQFSDAANKTREKMEKLAQVGSIIGLAGAAMLAPFLLAANKYVSAVGASETTGKRMVDAAKRWENVQVRIGRVTAERILPALEKALTITEKIAKFAEDNPGAVKGALITGTTLVMVGGLVTATANIVKTIATAQNLIGAGGTAALGGAASKIGAVALYATAVYIGAQAGLALGNAINRALGQKEQIGADNWTSLKQGAALISGPGIAAQILAALGQKNASSDLWQKNLNAFGLGSGADGVAKSSDASSVGAASSSANAAALRIWENGRLLLEREINDKLAKINADFGISEISERGRLAGEIAKLSEKSNAEYEKLITNARDADEKAEIAHRKSLANIRKNYDKSALEATNSRDALALDRAKSAYAESKRDENSRYRDETRDRHHQNAIAISDLRRRYADERAQAISVSKQRMIDISAQARAERETIRQSEAAKLAILREAYNAQFKMIRKMVGGQQSAETSLGGRASGGYVGAGLYQVGEKGDEFVLSNQATRAAESIVGGRLNQEKILRAMTLNVNLGRGMTIMQARRMIDANNAALVGAISGAL